MESGAILENKEAEEALDGSCAWWPISADILRHFGLTRLSISIWDLSIPYIFQYKHSIPKIIPDKVYPSSPGCTEHSHPFLRSRVPGNALTHSLYPLIFFTLLSNSDMPQFCENQFQIHKCPLKIYEPYSE